MKGAPIVMIAHGTGIAPFISIMERLNNLIRNSPDTDQLKLGEVQLFYGCRNENEEFLYKSKILVILDYLTSRGCSVQLNLAVSR